MSYGQVAASAQRAVRTGAEKFWYVVMCIYFGAGYLAKIPAKAALRDAGLCELTSWEKFWWVLENIPLGAGYLHKVIIKKALSEVGLVRT